MKRLHDSEDRRTGGIGGRGPGVTAATGVDFRVRQSFAQAFQAQRVPFQAIDIDDPATATLYERRLVLVRPDGHVAWRADEPPTDPVAIVDMVRGA